MEVLIIAKIFRNFTHSKLAFDFHCGHEKNKNSHNKSKPS